VSNAQTGHFAANLDIVFVGGEFHARRGWASVDVQLRGRNFRFVSTHLEPDAPPIQALQAAEIVAGPAATDLPVVFVCDCNSPADGSGTPTYANLIASGFTDAWSQRFPSEPGYTCCIEGTLTDPTPTFDERLDLVLFRGPFATTDIAIVGNDPADRTPSGLWPSDHAGVVGALRQSNGR
jgi:endonuclease/exonuclease/phosphatase family metal-dependent hydrolase